MLRSPSCGSRAGPLVTQGGEHLWGSAPDGSVPGQYAKRLLIPFAEYFPFGRIDLLRRNFARVREFESGAPAAPLPTAAGPAGILICNEAMFPEAAAQRVREGAGYLVN